MAFLTDAYSNVLMGVLLLIVVGGLVGLYLLSKVAPKGITLLVAVGIFVVAGLIMQSESTLREVHLVAGGLRLLGVGGIIAGIIDLVRRRPPVSEDTTNV